MPVNVTGVKQLQAAMKVIDPNLNKEMNTEIRNAMIPIRDQARGYMPANEEVLSGWRKINVTAEQKYRAFPFYDQNIARNGIVYSTGQSKRNAAGFSYTNYVANKSASGAIFETAGRKQRGKQGESLNPDAGIQFNQAAESLSSMKGTGANRGRAIYRAWNEDQGNVYAAVVKAIETVATKFNNSQLKKVA